MVLDTTVAGASANSYLGVAEADAWATDRPGRYAERWLAATLEAKENALIQAAVDIDSYVRPSAPYSATQALSFPRAIDVTGSPEAPFLPTRLRRAAFEQALHLLSNADTLDEAASRRARGHLSYTDDQGTGGTLALDPDFGRLAAPAASLLQILTRTRSGYIGSVRVQTVYTE